MTPQDLAPDIIELIERERIAGGYASDEDVLRNALTTLAEHRETVAGIRRGLDDVEAGRYVSLEQFDREFRAEQGLPESLPVDDE